MDHYQRLGVRRTASADEIHAAYRARAQRLHPDRTAGDERAMQDLNESWRVLRDPARRRSYDQSLRPPPMHRAPEDDVDDDEDLRSDLPADLHASLVRNLPWALILAVLAAIFVITAVARSPGEQTEREVDISGGECVVLQPGAGATEVSCTEPSARQVVSVVGTAQPCPTATERFEAPSLPSALCLDRADPADPAG